MTTKKAISVDVQIKVKTVIMEKYLFKKLKELFKNLKKDKKGRSVQWTEHPADDLFDIILDNDKYKEKLLWANAKNVKNGEYYDTVIEDLKERCSKRGEEFPFNVAQSGRSLNASWVSTEMQWWR